MVGGEIGESSILESSFSGFRSARGRGFSMSPTSGKMKYNSIQVLRCLAVMAVLILHSHFSIRQAVYQVPFFSQFGWIGVRLFFVISGFIIAERIGFERSLGAFLFRRYMRVFPLYALMTMVALLVSTAVGRGIFGTARTDSGGVYDPEPVAYFLKSLFIVPQDPWPAFAVGWSLEYEMVFYFSFGIAYFLGGRGGALATMLAMSVAGVVFSNLTRPLFDAMFLYFLFGCAAREVLSRESRPLIAAAPFVCIVSGAMWVLHLYKVFDLTGTGFILASATCFAALVVLCLDLEKRGKAFCHAGVLVRIGDMSFSVYLVHWLVVPISLYLTSDMTFGAGTAELLRILVILFALVASWAVWKFIELKIGRFIHGLVARRQVKIRDAQMGNSLCLRVEGVHRG
ncbi:MAG: acyltransferase family protein [Alphaproteobacteria bacterium]